MDRKEIILLIALGIFLAFSIYKKYFRKDLDSHGKSENRGNYPGNSTTDDDYEPYSGKKD